MDDVKASPFLVPLRRFLAANGAVMRTAICGAANFHGTKISPTLHDCLNSIHVEHACIYKNSFWLFDFGSTCMLSLKKVWPCLPADLGILIIACALFL